LTDITIFFSLEVNWAAVAWRFSHITFLTFRLMVTTTDTKMLKQLQHTVWQNPKSWHWKDCSHLKTYKVCLRRIILTDKHW